MKLDFILPTLLKLLIALSSTAVYSQTLPPIYENTPISLAPVKLIAEYPQGTFLENIAIDKSGNLLVNSHLDGKVYKINRVGKQIEWTNIDGTIAGIALNPNGSAVVTGWIKGKEPAVFIVQPNGKNRILTKLPDGMFPNGVVRIAPNQFLVADSYKGVIWEVNTRTKTPKVWLADETLARASSDNPTPAINGMKMFGDYLYASNTAKQLLVKIPVTNGEAGTPAVYLKNIGLDDFDFDKKGVLYGSTHVYNSVISVQPSGQMAVVAGLDQGMAGSTAIAVKSAKSSTQLYVTTNGGMSLPPPGGVQSGKVLSIQISTSTKLIR
jgi:hypothetical protein